MQIGRPGFEKGEEERTRKNYKKKRVEKNGGEKTTKAGCKYVDRGLRKRGGAMTLQGHEWKRGVVNEIGVS